MVVYRVFFFNVVVVVFFFFFFFFLGAPAHMGISGPWC